MYCDFFSWSELRKISHEVEIADTKHLLKVDCPEIMDS